MRHPNRDKAREAGLRHFSTGKLCRCGHEGPRLVSNGACCECQAVGSKRWRTKHPERGTAASRRYRDKHRLVINARNLIKRRRQDGLPEPGYPAPLTCEICRTPSRKRSLCIDHCHVTGKFRGWLCTPCNLGIGNFIDNPVLLRAAAEYLEQRQVSFLLPKGKTK